MVVPKPPVTLEGHCSVIHDNSLYTYSANGFASISLSQNATWSNMTMGEPVTGAACVKNQQSLYVVGGTSSSSSDYIGLQRYSFQDKKWETITPKSEDMSNRTNHGAVYLESSASIFVYGGNRDGSSIPTSDTFVISTAEPYNVSSYSGADASLVNAPILLPWSDDQAALVDGTTTARKVHLFKFNGTGVWTDSGVSLPQALSDDVRCAMINGSDSSKVLQSFDMSESPNTVKSLLLVNPGGKAADPAKVLGASSRKQSRRRAISVDNYPTYDDQYASSKTWSQFSLAQDDDGKMVAISGGSGTNSLALFNQTSNGWINATKLFYGDQSIQQILFSASSSATPTSTPSSVAGGGGGSSSGKVGTVVGATLGSVIGFAVILIAILFLLKHKKDKQKMSGQGRGGSDDKDRLSIQDQGEPLTRSAYPMAKSQAPLGSSSVDSLAIFSGKFGDEKKSQAATAAHPVYADKAPAKSPLSTVQSSRELLANSPYTPDADKAFEAGQTGAGGRPGDRRTNEGWSKYFQDNNATDLVGMQQQNEPTASADLAKSERRGSAWPMTTLTPLNFGFLEEPKPLGRVVTGSPTTEHPSSAKDGHLVIPEGQCARISSADSISVASDDHSDYGRSRYSSGIPAGQDDYFGRPVSSMYSQSYYPSTNNVSMVAPSAPYDTVRSSQARQSSVIIPDRLDENPPIPNQANVNTDMSWLNLNADR